MSRLLIWGTGDIAGRVLKNGIEGQIMGFIETHKSADLYQGKPVFEVDELTDEYDFIIVANTYSDEIYQICMENQINLDKVVFLMGVKMRAGLTELETIRIILGEKNYTDYCSEFRLEAHTFFKDDIKRYQELNTRENFRIQDDCMWPVIQDRYAAAGTIGNYFWQDLWAAKLIIKSGVKEHFDIGSRVDGFIAHLLAADIDVSIIDIREFPSEVENLHTIVDDATSLRQVEDASVESMSALCSLEHFGLGRYGDEIDPEACFNCFSTIQKKMKKGGKLYISLPIGRERVEFNAHRVFNASTIIECFSEMKLMEFSCTAGGELEYNVQSDKYDNDLHNGNYRYGLFYFTKK